MGTGGRVINSILPSSPKSTTDEIETRKPGGRKGMGMAGWGTSPADEEVGGALQLASSLSGVRGGALEPRKRIW